MAESATYALNSQLDSIWTSAWEPPRLLTPSEWAAQYRILPAGVTSEPGRWRNDRTPYLVGIMDALAEPGVEEVVFLKPVQVGFSEAIRNVLGYWIDNDAGPCLLVMPDEKSAKEAIDERIKPLLESTPELRRHLTDRAWDVKLTQIRLDSMPLWVGWAGSPQTLATRPCRYVLFDEVDKYPPFSGRESDPISLGTERTATYGYRRRIFKGSTPTTRSGAIWAAWEQCGDRRHYQVPCPHCGKYQRLVWAQVKWPNLAIEDKVKLADAIETNRMAWYECEHCKGRIDERHRSAMNIKGRWVSEGQTVGDEGTLVGGRPRSKRIGFHLNCLYSPWRTLSAAAAEFLRAKGDPAKMMNFRNSWLAEPFEDQLTATKPSAIRDKIVRSGPALVVPGWASAVFATADTQKDHFWFTVRAWGFDNRSALVHYGIARTFDELHRMTLQAVFKNEAGLAVSPTALLIDSGGGKGQDWGSSRTDEVYEFAAKDPSRVYPTKGASHMMRRPWTMTKIGTAGVMLYLLDTDIYKTRLAGLIADPEPQRWLPHKEVTDDYCMQLASEHRILDRKTGKPMWVTLTSGAANHLWDCEVLQVAAADIANVATMKPPEPPTPADTTPAANGTNWVTEHRGRW